MKLSKRQILQIAKEGERGKYALRSYFSNPDNIMQFAWFCFGDDYVTVESPEFHKEIVDLCTTQGFKAIAAPRGFAKSTVVNLIYMSWAIANRKWHYGLVISDSYTQSVEQVDALASALSNSFRFKWLYGDLTTLRWSRGDFVTKTGIRVQAKGQGMKIRGLRFKQYRPEFISIDDLENDEGVTSSDQRKKLRNWFRKNLIPAMSKTNRTLVYIGTILHHDSLLMNAINGNKEFQSWERKLYTAINTGKDGKQYSLWPNFWTIEELIRMRDDPTYQGYLGSHVFAQEYQNKPFSDEDAIIHRDWVQWVPERPPIGLIKRKIMIVDPAISKKDTADFTGKVMLLQDVEKNIYIVRIGNARLSLSESIKEIKEWDKSEDPEYVGIEVVAFQAALSQSLSGVPVREIKPDGDKVRRAITVSRHFEAGKIFIVDGIKHSEELYNQIVEFPKSAYDDLMDCVVFGVDILLNKPIGTYGNRRKQARTDQATPPSRRRRAGTSFTSGMMGEEY